MAPVSEQLAEQIHNTLKSLEDRLAKVEARLEGKTPSSSPSQDGMRMILMGPPGAGMLE
jgi:hypothetical protein